MNNPFQMNDWEIRKFLIFVLSIQLAMWGTIGLDAINIQIPIIRPIIGFIYLTFIPGIIVLRILRLHNLGNIETLLYAIGLSLSTIMFTGFLMNIVYPLIGISNPISFMPLIISMSAVVSILCILSYMRDKEYSDSNYIELRDIFSPPVLFLCMIPFLAVFGTYLVNIYKDNIILLFLIVVVSLIVILIGFDKFIPTKFYPLAVFVIAISLLFHNALISMYIWGWDIHVEYYIANLVISDSLWDPTFYSNVNAMLSIAILAPIFSAISDMSLTWILKIVYPLLFSLVPLGLFRVFQKQTDDKIAFLSAFFFMSLFVFYSEMIQLARQQIAELFLVLIILLFIDKNMNKVIRSILLIVFVFSLIVSHYGLSYIFMASLIVVRAIPYFYEQYHNKKITFDITTSFVFLFITFIISWYMYISSASSFNSIVYIGNNIANSIFTEFLNPEFAQGAAIILKTTASPLHDVGKYLHLIAQFFIGIGIFTLILNRSNLAFEKEYAAFSVVNFIILLFGIAVPFVASSLNTSRLYQISLIFLAPFFVIGGIAFFSSLNGIGKSIKIEQNKDYALKILSLFLGIFLLFNSGWVYEVAKDGPTSISLSAIDYPVFNEKEVTSAKWLNNVKAGMIYGDNFRWLLPNSLDWRTVTTISDNLKIKLNSYIYLGTFNIREEKVLISHRKGVNSITEYISSTNITSHRNKIYDNNGSEVYYL